MGGGLGELWGRDTLVGVLSLMDGHVWWPDSVMDLTLSEVPLLEVVTPVFLMGGMDLGSEDHLVHKFSLLETLVYEEIILLMHGSVTALARSLEDLETSSQSAN